MEKLILSDLKKLAKEIKYAIKTQKKFFANGVCEPDENAIQEAQNLPTDTLKQTIDRKRAVKKAIKDRSNYRHAVKPYTDAKRLLKYLYSTKQLRAGTQYFIKDVNGVETNWDFERCVYNTGYQYEFSCEVFDDDRDVYQALYISKDYRGKLDWADTEWVREKVK